MTNSTTIAPGAPPPTRPPSLETAPIDQPGRLIAVSLVGGLAFDFGVRGGITNMAMTLGLLAAVVVVVTRPSLSRHGVRLALMAAAPALFLSVWTSPWIAVPNLLVAVGLVAAATAYSGAGSVFDTSPGNGVARLLAAVRGGISRVAPLVRMAPRPEPSVIRAGGRTGRAVLLALPLLIILVALLASADAVFASMIAPDVPVGPALGHMALALLLAVVLLLAGLAVGSESEQAQSRGSFAASEIATVLGLAIAVLGLFVVSQLMAMTGAGQRLVDQAGLTPAEYARSGFFQLCWACLVIVIYLGLTRRMAAPGVFDRPLVRGMSAAVPALSLGLVAVSLRRMALYDQAFGLTMLRLAVIVAVAWIGIVLVMIAARNLGLRPDRDWLAGTAAAAGLTLLLAANLVNLEAFVVRHNVARAATGAAVDVEYLATLSEDAVPAIAAAADRAGPDLEDRLIDALHCDNRPTGIAAANLAAITATKVRNAHCDPASQRAGQELLRRLTPSPR